MNVEIGAEAALFPEKEYISGIFVAVQSRWNVKTMTDWWTDGADEMVIQKPSRRKASTMTDWWAYRKQRNVEQNKRDKRNHPDTKKNTPKAGILIYSMCRLSSLYSTWRRSTARASMLSFHRRNAERRGPPFWPPANGAASPPALLPAPCPPHTRPPALPPSALPSHQGIWSFCNSIGLIWS
jgi:hypothetical protein